MRVDVVVGGGVGERKLLQRTCFRFMDGHLVGVQTCGIGRPVEVRLAKYVRRTLFVFPVLDGENLNVMAILKVDGVGEYSSAVNFADGHPAGGAYLDGTFPLSVHGEPGEPAELMMMTPRDFSGELVVAFYELAILPAARSLKC